MSINKFELMNNNFTYVAGVMSAYTCNHCGALVGLSTWELHVMACPALAKWDREQATPELPPDGIGHP